MISDKKLQEIYNEIVKSKEISHGIQKVAKQRGVKESTIERYYRKAVANLDAKDIDIERYEDISKRKSKAIKKLSNKDVEVLESFASTNSARKINRTVVIDKPNKHFTFGYFTDTHIGSAFFSENAFLEMVDRFNRLDVDFVCCSGDIVEGCYNRRDGHIFECTHRGYDEQKYYAIELLSKIKQPLYIIDGNHDRTFTKIVNAKIVEDIASHIDNAKHVGSDQGDIRYGDITIRMFHGGDGSTLAKSYRVQKLVDGMNPVDRPDILLCGHTHKYVNVIHKGVWCFSGGSLSSQTHWMRGKTLDADMGYFVISTESGKNGLSYVNAGWRSFEKPVQDKVVIHA